MSQKEKTIRYLENVKKRAENIINGKTRKEILKEVAFARKYQEALIPIIPELENLTGGKHYCLYRNCENIPRTFLGGRFIYCDKHLPIMYKLLKKTITSGKIADNKTKPRLK